jgi:hypothetical protein
VTGRAVTATLAVLAALLTAPAPASAAPVPVPAPNGGTTTPNGAGAAPDRGGKGTDVLGQLFGGEKYSGDLGRYPLTGYQLDWDIDTDVDLGPIPVAPKPQGAVADVAEGAANILWTLSLLIAKFVGGMFAWAFSVDFLTGRHGILRPISDAARVMYRDLFGRDILYAAIAVAGGYAIVQSKRGRAGHGAGMLAASVAYAVVAVGVANNMQAVAAPVYRATQEASSSLLSMRATGRISSDAAERQANVYIRDTFIDGPYLLLQFGGVRHCVNPNRTRDGFPVPALPDDPGPKVCRENAPYAQALLADPPGSDARRDTLRALASGTSPFDKVDAPAADMMLQGNAYLRLVVAASVLAGMLFVGAFITLAAVLIAGAAIAFAVGLAFAPAMVPLAFVPVIGEATVRFWASALGGCLLTKVAFSLLLGVLMIANEAVTATAGAALPVGYAYAVNTLMFAGAFLYRKRIVHGIMGATARLDRRAVGRVQRVATSAITHPVRTMTGRTAFAAAAGAVGGAVAPGRDDKDDKDDKDGGKGGGSRNGGAPVPPAWEEPPRDHEPAGGRGAPPAPDPTPERNHHRPADEAVRVVDR